MATIRDDPGVQGLAQIGRNAVDRVLDLEKQLTAVTAERDALRAIVDREGNRNDELNALRAERDALRAALLAIEPYLDSIICYASTMSEYDGNRVYAQVRAAIDAARRKE